MRQYQKKKNPNNKVVLVRDKRYINVTLYEDEVQEHGTAHNPRTHQHSYLANRNNRRDYLQPKHRYGGWVMVGTIAIITRRHHKLWAGLWAGR